MGQTVNKIKALLGGAAGSAVTLMRLMLPPVRSTVGRLSRRTLDRGKQLVILGNGPSLRDNLENDLDFLVNTDTLAVNFFGNTPAFAAVKPRYYLLADPHFFEKADSDPNVARLMENLLGVDYPMTLFVPASAGKTVSRILRKAGGNDNLTVATYHTRPAEGYRWLRHLLMRRRMAMPRPRNVLIPSLMVGIWLGYKDIYILGADHTWLSTLSVNDNNEVVSIQPHFYKEDDREQKRIRTEYLRHPLHEVLNSMTVAFESYHRIAPFADSVGCNIYNSTPGSMIDAFRRRPLPK